MFHYDGVNWADEYEKGDRSNPDEKKRRGKRGRRRKEGGNIMVTSTTDNH